MALVTIRHPELDYVLNSPSGAVGRYLDKKSLLIELAAKRQVGVKTGALRASIHTRHFRDPRGQFVRIGSELKYAYLHHEGSKPHLIVAKTGGTLKFRRGSSVIYTHSVRHPGTRPNRFLSDNLHLVR